MGIGLLAQIDTDLMRRLLQYSETATLERQVLMGVLIVLGIMGLGMVVLLVFMRGAVKQSGGLVDALTIQANTNKNTSDIFERTFSHMTAALDKQAAVMAEQLDAIKKFNISLDVNNTAILRVEEGMDRGHVAMDARLAELTRLLNATADETRRSFIAANEAFEGVRSELKHLSSIHQQSAESGLDRFQKYEKNNGEQWRKMQEMTQALQAVLGTLTALKSDVAHIKDNRKTGETQIVNLTEENNGS